MRYKHTLLEAIKDKLTAKERREVLYLAEKKDQERYDRLQLEKKLGGKNEAI